MGSEAERALVALYAQASPAVRRRGRSWYPETQRKLRGIAERTGATQAHAAAVFAIVSPMVQVMTALEWTEQILAGERHYGAFHRQALAIERVLASGYPRRHVSGPKVSAFYRAIQGDREALVIDRWAAYAAGHPTRGSNIPRAVWREIDAAYRAAAAAVGETVRAFQAIVWIVIRESTPTAAGFVPKLRDVTA
jgi:hypothetical protein